MENVYHHFEDPTAMNASIFRTVKAGGRVAVMDFPPNGDEAKDPKDRDEEKHHGVKAATVQAELERAGFELVKVEKVGTQGFIVVVKKPGTTSAQGSSE